MKKIFSLIFLVNLVMLLGCSEVDPGEPVLQPSFMSPYVLFPNDPAISDSVAAYLTSGAVLSLHPGVSYTLSFDKDSSLDEAPVLQLFRVGGALDDQRYSIRHVRSLDAVEKDGRYYYDFVCEENDRARWVTTLALNGDFYMGNVKNVRLDAEGPYSKNFSINLIVVGKVVFPDSSMTVQAFADSMLKSFRKFFKGIRIDTLYVRYAHEHPDLGKKYPADEPWLAGRSSDDLFVSELGGWPEKELKKSLDLVLVHRIEADHVLGYSYLYSGNFGGGEGSTVVIGTREKTPYGESEVTVGEILETAVHESGHFLGLRHTTSTRSDMSETMDYSVLEDGFTDTPFCRDLLLSGLLKKNSVGHSDFAVPAYRLDLAAAADFSVTDCPDHRNLMFPSVTGEEFEGFSEQQLEHVRKNLTVFPH